MSIYNHKEIESKWQKVWEKEEIYKTSVKKKKLRYVLDMFPYPSGASMHVGHLEGYVGTDILTRYLRMNGFNVLHPMGWDAFGLPAENFAIKTGVHPDKETHKNIAIFKKQLVASGLSYDWDKEIDTSSPEFYKWTQWLFIQFFKKGLVYKKKSAVNWCPKDETVLANEQVIDDKCERCDTPVIQKDLDQWFFKITDYADRLIDGLTQIDWLEEVKTQQKNWIGKKEGRIIKFDNIEIFTTRPETINSVTFLAIASDKNKFSGKYVINPANNEKIPVWEADYVSKDFGTGAIMGVPAYDEKDALFAKKYHIDIVKREFLKDIIGEKHVSYHLRDWLISRQRYWGCPIPMIYCEHCATLQGQTLQSGWFPVPEKELPVLLPTDVDFLPHGKSPIARSTSFQKDVVCPSCGMSAKREVDTMDTYVDSSWYFIRFCDPKNTKEFAQIKKIIAVSDYVGGGHVVQHLLFARFFWKVLYDLGYIDKKQGDEPFLKLRAPGWILGPDSRKMSKRWGNMITPDDIIPKFGADTLRVYEMFMGPFDISKPWSITGVEGAHRFLGRVWRLFQNSSHDSALSTVSSTVRHGRTITKDASFVLQNSDVISKMHKTIKKVGEDIENYKFNTAISAIMEFVNMISDADVSSSLLRVSPKGTTSRSAADNRLEIMTVLCQLLAPFAPHMMEEVWCTVLGNKSSVHLSNWPEYDPKYLIEDKVVIAVQVNGKLRSQFTVDGSRSADKEFVIKLAKTDPKVAKWLKNGQVTKEIFIPNKLINLCI